MNHDRIAKVQRDLSALRSRCQRIGSEAEMAVRGRPEAELAALKGDLTANAAATAEGKL
jgi:hypothetical protein